MQFTDQFCRSVIENMMNGFAFHRIIIDGSGEPADYEYIEINAAFERFTGLTRERVIGRTIREVSPEIDKDTMDWITFYGDVALNGTKASIEQYSETFDRWYTIHVYSPEKGFFITIFNDITELKKNEEKLQLQNESLSQLYEEQTALYEELTASEEELRQQNDELIKFNQFVIENERRLKKAQQLAHVGNWEIDLNLGTMWGSEEAFRIYGFERTDPYLPLSFVQKMVHGDDRKKMDDALKNLIGKNAPYDEEFRVLFTDGQEKFMHSVAELELDQAGRPCRVLGVIQDITVSSLYEKELREKNEELSALYEELSASEEELKQNYERLMISMEENKKQQDKLEYLAYHDSLTDLPNRLLFMDRMNSAIGLLENNGRQSAVVFMDIDNFKDVNDTLGHNVGDKQLKAIAQRLSQKMHGHEILARLGGDEFAFFLQNIADHKEVYEFCERLRDSLTEPVEFDGYSFHVNASVGITIYPQDGTTAEELLKNADTAMYRAKSLGKDNIQFFREDMKDDMLRRLAIEKCLRRALKAGGFSLNYQPQIELGTGNIRSFEALLRWKDSELGAVSPMEFIPVAEDTGLIVPLGEWVLREACSQGAEWNRTYSPELLVSVNISAVQLRQADFVDMVKNILDATGFSPEHLELEITESLMINSFEQTVAMLEELKSMGVKVSMDDFGTGYSSLNYIKQLPLDTLKIDKSFILDIGTESVEKEITKAIISLVHKLHIEVVAEGVETESQLACLLQCNCDNIQGYLLSKPVPAEKVPDIMKESFKVIINQASTM